MTPPDGAGTGVVRAGFRRDRVSEDAAVVALVLDVSALPIEV